MMQPAGEPTRTWRPATGPTLVLLACLAGLALASWYRDTRPSGRGKSASAGNWRIDINQADRTLLMQLPQLGDKLATAIVDHRDRVGGFQSLDDLLHVHGVGPAHLAAWEPWIVVNPDTVGERPVRVVHKTQRPDLLIDVNTATLEELQQLPGIGPKLSGNIIAERNRRKFERIEDLRRVPLIGVKTIEKLKPYVRVGTATVSVREAE